MPKKGDILFIKTYDIVGSAIRKFTNCDFNHCGIFIDENNVVEARPSGTKKTTFLEYLARYRKHKIQYALGGVKEITPDGIEKMTKFMESKIGTPYDFLQVTTIGLWILFGWYTKYNVADVKWAWSCSELVAKAMEQAGYTVKQTKDLNNVTPADVYRSEHVKLLYTTIV